MSFPQPLRAVITGAGSGLGRALALDLAQRGASVIVSDIVLPSAEETAELVRQQGARAEAVRCDVTDRDAVFALVDETEQRLGGIDLIANNAGIAIGGPAPRAASTTHCDGESTAASSSKPALASSLTSNQVRSAKEKVSSPSA